MKSCIFVDFMTELYRYVGADVDVPAGDMGLAPGKLAICTEYYKAYNPLSAFYRQGISMAAAWAKSYRLRAALLR